MDRKLSLTLYRSLLRSIRSQFQAHKDFRILSPLKHKDLGTGAVLSNEFWATYLEELPFVADLDESKHTYTERDFRDLVRDWFKADQEWVSEQEHLTRVLEALQFIHFQSSMNEASSITKKEGVEIIASSVHFDRVVSKKPYAFAYRVLIRNCTNDSIMIKDADWRIEDANGYIERVTEPETLSCSNPFSSSEAICCSCVRNCKLSGQPILHAGECFLYVNGADIDTPTGNIHACVSAYNVSQNKEFKIENEINLDVKCIIP